MTYCQLVHQLQYKKRYVRLQLEFCYVATWLPQHTGEVIQVKNVWLLQQWQTITGVTGSDAYTPERRVECRDATAGCHQCCNPIILPAAAAAADRQSLCLPPLSMSSRLYKTNHSTHWNYYCHYWRPTYIDRPFCFACVLFDTHALIAQMPKRLPVSVPEVWLLVKLLKFTMTFRPTLR